MCYRGRPRGQGRPRGFHLCQLASACWALYQLRKYVDYKMLVMVYNSTLHSHLMYCISSWGSASNSNMRPLFLLQKRAMRIITHSNRRTRTTPLFSRLQILKLHDIYKLEIAKLMHKVHKKALNICNTLTNNYTLLDNIHSRNTRRKHQKNYFVTRVSSKQAQKCSQYNGPKIWNEIPLQLKEMNFFKFKKELKRKLICAYK